MKTLTLILVFIASSAVASDTVKFKNNMIFNHNVETTDADLKKQTEAFLAISKKPESENATLVPWLIEKANVLPSFYIYELAKRLWSSDKDKALEWFAVAKMRAQYDGMRCAGKTGGQGVMYLPAIAMNVVQGIEQDRVAYGVAGMRAIARKDLFEGTASRWWPCGAELKPEAEWLGIRKSVLKMFKEHFEAQGKPQDDPVPMSKKKYSAIKLARDASEYKWLDSEQLVISVFGAAKLRRTGMEETFVLWRRNGTSEEVKKHTGMWCAGNGILAYETKREKIGKGPDTVTIASGPIGAPVETVIDYGRKQICEKAKGTKASCRDLSLYRQSPFDCRWVKNEQLSGIDDSFKWIPLLQGHGFIQFVNIARNQTDPKLLYYETESASPRQLPIEPKKITGASVRYIPFKKAYLIVSRGDVLGDQRVKGCVQAWWFWPEKGNTEEICLPTLSPGSTNVNTAPSQIGFLSGSAMRKTHNGPRAGGLYLTATDGKVEKIYEGWVNGFKVSPDGCAVAVHNLIPDSVMKTEMAIIELCQ